MLRHAHVTQRAAVVISGHANQAVTETATGKAVKGEGVIDMGFDTVPEPIRALGKAGRIAGAVFSLMSGDGREHVHDSTGSQMSAAVRNAMIANPPHTS